MRNADEGGDEREPEEHVAECADDRVELRLALSMSCWRGSPPCRGHLLDGVCTSAGSALSSTATSTASNWSMAPVTCAVATSQAASVAPAKPSLSPRPTRAVIVNRNVPVSVITSIVSPTAKSSRIGVACRWPPSSAPDGASLALDLQAGQRLVAAPGDARRQRPAWRRPCRPGRSAGRRCSPGSMAATPSTAATCSATDAGMGSRRRSMASSPKATDADLEVDVLADLGEQVVERLAQAVGEDEGATTKETPTRMAMAMAISRPAGTDAPPGDQRDGPLAHWPNAFILSSTLRRSVRSSRRRSFRR